MQKVTRDAKSWLQFAKFLKRQQWMQRSGKSYKKIREKMQKFKKVRKRFNSYRKMKKDAKDEMRNNKI